MKHETPTIAAEPRERIGSRYARRLRQAGRLPAMIYGHGMGSVPVSVDEKSTLAILHDGAHLVNLTLSDKSETCLVKDLQFGYLGDNVIHIDFARVDLEEEVEVNVHLEFEGEPAAAKEAGAIIVHDLTELEITCKAGEIPDQIVVDIANLVETITIGELKLPEGVRCNLDPETTVVHIEIVAEEAEGEEAAVVGEAEPEVIGGKSEEDDAEEKD